jgi:hypothetical protein
MYQNQMKVFAFEPVQELVDPKMVQRTIHQIQVLVLLFHS